MTWEEVVLLRLHEAGHAVVGHVLGARVVGATLEGVEFGLGFDGEPLAVAALAGGVAARLFGPRWRSPNRGASDSDLATAASALGVDRLDPFARARLERAAEGILFDHERTVRAVAGALGRVDRLNAHQVARLASGSSVDAVVGPSFNFA